MLNVSAYLGEPPPANLNRKIVGGPLYQAQKVIEILQRDESAVTAWTRKCIQDLQKYTLDNQDAAKLITEALQQGDFRGSEWCRQKPDGPWAACDAYSLIRMEWIQHAHKDLCFEYYIKFAINKTGRVILLVSCHLPEDRG